MFHEFIKKQNLKTWFGTSCKFDLFFVAQIMLIDPLLLGL
jgi:hypothetical protein